jgi:hypothetical protein
LQCSNKRKIIAEHSEMFITYLGLQDVKVQVLQPD